MFLRNISTSLKKFILHLHPNKIDERATNINRTFGLGGISALLIVILVVTGLILRFSYVPTVEHAYDSVSGLQKNTIFGQLLRNLHHMAAILLIVVAFLHLLRVYYSQSIYYKRASNWIFGLVLFILILASAFTGYLLPWDQLSFWAVTVITQLVEYVPFIGSSLAEFIRSGDTVNGNTLLNFYTLHTGIIPIFILLLMSFHFWQVRKAGGIALPSSDQPAKKVSVIPNLLWKEIMVAAIVIAFLFLVSLFNQAPLLQEANPLKNPNPTKAPWYFLGAQELLLHLHPVFVSTIIPVFLLAFLFYLPFISYKNIQEGEWFNSPEGKKIVIWSAVVSFVYTFILIYALDHFLHFSIWLHDWPSWIVTGVIPVLLYKIPLGAFLLYFFKKPDIRNVEFVMSITTMIFSSYICMLLIALLLRGQGMVMVI